VAQDLVSWRSTVLTVLKHPNVSAVVLVTKARVNTIYKVDNVNKMENKTKYS
jgi:hypothetical protein